MEHRGVSAFAVLATVLFSGCAGKTLPATAAMDAPDVVLGMIGGTVTDDQFQPLHGVALQLLSGEFLPIGNVTSDVGVFEFEPVPFGDYRISAYLEGYEAVVREVSVESDEPVDVSMQLVPIPVHVPYQLVDVYTGLIRCGVSAVLFPTTCCNAWDKAMDDILGVGAPSIPVACPEAIPHDAHVVLFDVPTGHRAFVGETDWEANVAMSALYSINRTHQLASLSGPAILRQELLSDTNTTTASLATLGTVPAPETAFRMGVLLNYDGNMQTEVDEAAGVGCRAAFSSPCNGIGVATEHRFVHYLTVFINEAPANLSSYSALAGAKP